MREILYDFWHALAHMDRSVWALVLMLLKRPGRVARDYVDGKRKRYFGPFAFLVVVVGIASATLHMSAQKSFVIASIGSPMPNAALEASATAAVGRAFERNMNVVFLLEAPILAAFSRLIYRGYAINFAEHLVLASYTSGMRSLFYTLVILLGWAVLGSNQRALVYGGTAGLVIWLAYYGFAAAQFMQDVRFVAALKGASAAALAWLTTQLLLSLITAGSILYLVYR
jgi:hypothetical protein